MNKTISVTVAITENKVESFVETNEVRAAITATLGALAEKRKISLRQMAESVLKDNSLLGMQKQLGLPAAKLVRSICKSIYSEV